MSLGRPFAPLVGLTLVTGLLLGVGPATAAAPAASGVGSSTAPTTTSTGRSTTGPTKTGGPTVRHGCVASVGDTETRGPVPICWSLFRPSRATARRPVPVLMHSHGWGGQRVRDAATFAPYLSRGYAVLSFDQRGFGESGGKAHVQNPAYEGRDVRALVALLARQPWIRRDGPGDPRLGAIGGSYGGGFQYLGAFESLRTRGRPVFDALAPEITWWDLRRSLAPAGVVRSEWALSLSAAGASAVPRVVLAGLAAGVATGTVPDGSSPGEPDLVSFFAANGPSHHVAAGRRLDIPVLVHQGATDTLFPLEEGLTTFQRALTPRAKRRSLFVGFNGGHTLPSLSPGLGVAGDPCSRRLGGGSFEDLTVRFFDESLRGRETGLRGRGRFHLATAQGSCVSVDSVQPTRTVRARGPLRTTTALGVPRSVELADGPLRVAGSPYVEAEVSALGVDNRAFVALAVGRTPATAKVVQGNVLPLVVPGPVRGAGRRVRLPSVAVDVPRGQHLYLQANPASEVFVGASSRLPGVLTLRDVRAHLPVVRPRR